MTDWKAGQIMFYTLGAFLVAIFCISIIVVGVSLDSLLFLNCVVNGKFDKSYIIPVFIESNNILLLYMCW